MRTYRELFRTPEFASLFGASCAQVAATTLAGLALATLVYARTESPLLSALSMFGPSFAGLIGATTLLSVADRVPPRAAMTLVALAAAVAGLLLATPGLPLPAMFAVIVAQGVVASIGAGVLYGLLGEILPPDGYVLGRSVLNMSVGAMQVTGFAIGGILLAVVSPRTTLVIGATLAVGSALVVRLGLSPRPPRASGRPSVAITWRINRQLLSSPARRAIYLSMWVPNGLVVGCEALFVPYAPQAAAALFVAAALGMLLGDMAAGRFLPPQLRQRSVTPLRFLLAAPYLLFVLPLSLPVAVTAAAVASAGFAATLLLQERLIALTGEEVRGQALGLHATGMKAMQAIGATLAGLTAQFVPTGTAMTTLAVASLAVTAMLGPGLRLSNPQIAMRAAARRDVTVAAAAAPSTDAATPRSPRPSRPGSNPGRPDSRTRRTITKRQRADHHDRIPVWNQRHLLPLDLVRAHHLVVLVVDDVAVPDVPSGEVEAGLDPGDLAR